MVPVRRWGVFPTVDAGSRVVAVAQHFSVESVMTLTIALQTAL
jgi:hypothetical protein